MGSTNAEKIEEYTIIGLKTMLAVFAGQALSIPIDIAIYFLTILTGNAIIILLGALLTILVKAAGIGFALNYLWDWGDT